MISTGLGTPMIVPCPIAMNSSGMPEMIVRESDTPSIAPVMIEPVASVAMNAEIPR
jgi:hypothetical protein